MSLLTIKEASRLIGISRQRLHKLISDGRVPYERDPLWGRYLLDPAEVRKLQQTKRKNGRPRKKDKE